MNQDLFDAIITHRRAFTNAPAEAPARSFANAYIDAAALWNRMIGDGVFPASWATIRPPSERTNGFVNLADLSEPLRREIEAMKRKALGLTVEGKPDDFRDRLRAAIAAGARATNGVPAKLADQPARALKNVTLKKGDRASKPKKVTRHRYASLEGGNSRTSLTRSVIWVCVVEVACVLAKVALSTATRVDIDVWPFVLALIYPFAVKNIRAASQRAGWSD